jgi:hypothetical protein
MLPHLVSPLFLSPPPSLSSPPLLFPLLSSPFPFTLSSSLLSLLPLFSYPFCTGRVKALWTYDAVTAEELSFKEGDLLVNVVAIDDEWLQGETESGAYGSFPKSYLPDLIRYLCHSTSLHVFSTSFHVTLCHSMSLYVTLGHSRSL